MKLPNSEQTSRPWRINELVRDFHLLDVWALPTPGGPDDFPRLVEIFGWDDVDEADVPDRELLRDRLPEDLRKAPPGPSFDTLPFQPVYLLDDEWAAEVINKTVHGVMHLSWVPDGQGRYRGQMSVYVKPNGLFGRAYLAAIGPFRHLVVYPPMLRELERRWRQQGGAAPKRAAPSPA